MRLVNHESMNATTTTTRRFVFDPYKKLLRSSNCDNPTVALAEKLILPPLPHPPFCPALDLRFLYTYSHQRLCATGASWALSGENVWLREKKS